MGVWDPPCPLPPSQIWPQIGLPVGPSTSTFGRGRDFRLGEIIIYFPLFRGGLLITCGGYAVRIKETSRVVMAVV